MERRGPEAEREGRGRWLLGRRSGGQLLGRAHPPASMARVFLGGSAATTPFRSDCAADGQQRRPATGLFFHPLALRRLRRDRKQERCRYLNGVPLLFAVNNAHARNASSGRWSGLAGAAFARRARLVHVELCGASCEPRSPTCGRAGAPRNASGAPEGARQSPGASGEPRRRLDAPRSRSAALGALCRLPPGPRCAAGPYVLPDPN